MTTSMERETILEPKKKKYQLDYFTRETITEKISKDSQPDTYYYIMVVLSCTVATYGLLSNSTAVIIGAMLIAPLMNPILGSGLALITGNNPLLKVTIKAEFIGAVIAVALSTFLTLLLPVSDLTSEVLARTAPTLIDLIIALTSGAAGAYAICYRAGATLPGVAIATALMPPLCVVGITLAKQEYHLAGGALLLFIANMVAINVIAMIIFQFAGFNTSLLSHYLNLDTPKEKQPYVSRLVGGKIIYPILLLVIVSIPLIFLLKTSIESDQREKIIRNTLEEGLAVMAPDATINALKFTRNDTTFRINVDLHSAQIILPEDIRKLENSLEYKLTAPVQIIANIAMIQRVNNEGATDGYKALLPETKPEVVEVVQLKTSTPEEIIAQVVNEKLQLFDGTLHDFSFAYQQGTGTYNVLLDITSEETLDKAFIKTLETILEEELKRKVVVTLVPTEIEEPEVVEDVETLEEPE
ncbi:TIGR00341 family protein [Lysinibacillus sp. KU-BSD001]|uniref:TIGR00341 family protein n=1 Tax=Lysinibacillus sp. KU-BSD001 TaxID=3141328 RepID=UPI0036E67A5D